MKHLCMYLEKTIKGSGGNTCISGLQGHNVVEDWELKGQSAIPLQPGLHRDPARVP